MRLLAVRLSTSCVSKVLAGKPQKEDIFTSCGGLRVLTAQELLAALLARALFLGCTVRLGLEPDLTITKAGSMLTLIKKGKMTSYTDISIVTGPEVE